MSEESARPRYREIVEALDAAWHWWLTGIAGVVPQALRSQMSSGALLTTIDLQGDEVVLRRTKDGETSEIGRLARAEFDAPHLQSALAANLSRPWFLRDSYILRLPDALALKRNLSLPLAARGSIGNLLDIELERQSPIDAAEIFHDYRIVQIDRAANRLDIVWRIVRRKSVAPILEICRQAGVELGGIAFLGDTTLPDGGDFPLQRRARLLLRLRHSLVRNLMLLILVLLLAIGAGAYARNQAALDAFSERVEQEHVAARSSLLLKRQIDLVRKRAALLLQEKRHPGTAQLLAEATRLLPDGTWLTDFEYRDGEVRLKGYTNASPSLLAKFDASPLFSSAEFRAPLTQAQRADLEQFDMALKVRKGAK